MSRLTRMILTSIDTFGRPASEEQMLVRVVASSETTKLLEGSRKVRFVTVRMARMVADHHPDPRDDDGTLSHGPEAWSANHRVRGSFSRGLTTLIWQ
jgi:hypothetical protein